MLLDEWIFYMSKKGKRVTCTQIAKDLKCADQTILNIKNRITRPQPRLARAIQDYTHGLVTSAELRSVDAKP